MDMGSDLGFGFGLGAGDVAADARADASIVADMLKRANEHDERVAGIDRSVPDVVRHPRPAVKPRADAQWDEAAGRWEVWSEASQGWVSLEDGTVQQAGTRSVEPHEHHLLRPPPIELR
jgi:hypothetical protein